MSYQETKVPDAIKLTDYPNKSMQCYYIGSKTVDTKFGEQQLHEFQRSDGSKVSVWGFAALNRLLEHTPKGIMTKVTYTGLSKEKNKYGKQVHTCTVFFDTDQQLENFKDNGEDTLDEAQRDLPF